MRTRAALYEESASWFRHRSMEAEEAARTVSRSLPPSTLAGGAVREALDDAMGVSIQNLRDLAGVLQHLALESMRRALVCREYDMLLRRHRAALDSWLATPASQRGALGPSAPRPPAAWVAP